MAKKKNSSYTVPVPPGYVPTNPYESGDFDPTGLSGGIAPGAPAPSAPDAPPAPDYGYDSGGGDTYYNVAAPEPLPRQELASSPEWLAYLNQLGLSRDQFTADIQRQHGVAQTLAQQAAGDIAAEGVGSRRNIAGSLETRGMARSGQLIRGLADQRAGEGRRQAGVQTGLASNLSGLESQLAQKLIELDQQRASQELSLRSSGAYT